MNTIKLASGHLSANMSVEELRKSGNACFGVEESPLLSGMLCEITADVTEYSFGLAQGDKVFIVGLDHDGDALVAIIEDEDYKNPLVQAIDVDDIKIL